MSGVIPTRDPAIPFPQYPSTIENTRWDSYRCVIVEDYMGTASTVDELLIYDFDEATGDSVPHWKNPIITREEIHVGDRAIVIAERGGIDTPLGSFLSDRLAERLAVGQLAVLVNTLRYYDIEDDMAIDSRFPAIEEELLVNEIESALGVSTPFPTVTPTP